MKKLPLLLVALSAMTAVCQAQVNTVPVGFYTVEIPGGSVANPAFKTISFPLSNSAAFAGAISSLDGATQFSVGGANWSPSGLASASAPHLVKITSGDQIGRVFLITANTANQLTVDLSSSPIVTDLTASLDVGDTVQIVPAFTLGTLFGTSTTTFVTGATVSEADNIWVLSGQTWNIYFHNGTSWRMSGAVGNKNNTIVYPDEGILIVHVGASPLPLTFTGTVPAVNEKTDINGTGSTFLANRFPVDTQLNDLGLQALPGWVTNSSADLADNIWTWNPNKIPSAGWDTYFHNGTSWRKFGAVGNKNTDIIPAGTALIIIKVGTGAHATLANVRPYSL